MRQGEGTFVQGEGEEFSVSLYLLLEQGSDTVARLKGDGHAKVHWDWLVQSRTQC